MLSLQKFATSFSRKACGRLTYKPSTLSKFVRPLGNNKTLCQVPSLHLISWRRHYATTNTPPPSTDKGFLAKTKELFVFYKNGIKQLWTNHKLAKELKFKRDQGRQTLNRREVQLIRTAETDMVKLIPFGLILVTIAELIPLLVIFAPHLIPSTCITPKQLDKRREKLYEKQLQIHNKMLAMCDATMPIADFKSLANVVHLHNTVSKDLYFQKMNSRLLSDFCKFMGLSHHGTRRMLQKRLETYLDYLFEDDQLLLKEGINTLTFEELQKANEERGMRSVHVSKTHMRYALQYWIALHTLQNPEIADEVLLFSRVILLNAEYGLQQTGKKYETVVISIQ